MATVIPTTAGAGAPREGHRRVAAMALMSRTARVMFVSILVAGALISLVCIFASGTWIDRPFAGGTINERMVVTPANGRSIQVPLAKRSEEHTSELQSRLHLVCRLLLEK